MKLSRNYLIAALVLIALYLMFFRAAPSGYAQRPRRVMSRA